jgi:hypothetical protein
MKPKHYTYIPMFGDADKIFINQLQTKLCDPPGSAHQHSPDDGCSTK